jgi:hypothetical protein
VKRSGRDEPILVAIHIWMITKLGISLYTYLFLKLAKMLYVFVSLMFSLQQSQRTREQKRFCPEVRGGGRWPK